MRYPLSDMPVDPIVLFVHLAGFIIGLGAVTVIDWHGFMAQRSGYWTESTIRAHKVTKPLIWVGLLLAVGSGALLYRPYGPWELSSLQAVLAPLLILNGVYLTFVISPALLKREKEGHAAVILPKRMQNQITLSFLFSFFGWWISVALLVRHLTRS